MSTTEILVPTAPVIISWIQHRVFALVGTHDNSVLYIVELYVVSISYIQLIDLFVACNTVSPNDASYSCIECAGAGGTHDDTQAWLATCDGREYINAFVITLSDTYTGMPTHMRLLLIQINHMYISHTRLSG